MSYFLDPSTSRHYFLWKTDHLLTLQVSKIMIEELGNDGLSFKAGSSPKLLLQPDRLEEVLIVEAP